jgi:alkylation response protein AidB-like acyl-CoA dehydrogenase
MNFSFTDEQRMIRDTAEAFLSGASSSEAVRSAMATESGFEAALWKQVCEELYWQAMHIPEEHGGLGLGYVELAATMEQMGRFLFCSPFFSSVCLATNAVLVAGSEAQKADLLGKLIAGETATLAHHDPAAVHWEAEGDKFWLNGKARYVIDGHSADWVIVAAVAASAAAAGSAAEVAMFVVPGDQLGLTRRWLPAMDQTRKQAELVFENVELEAGLRLAGGSAAALANIENLATIALAAEQVGGAQQSLDSTIAYTQDRVQFGRSIASFQAVKHKAADMMVKVEAARSASYYAACIAQEFLAGSATADELAEAASVAKAACSEAYLFNAGCGIQLHSGVGFTWEYDIQLYFKRAKSSETLLGNASQHRERLVTLLLDEA